MSQPAERRRALVVCAANVCRSPVAARLLQRAVGDQPDYDGHLWTVTSAGIGPLGAPIDPHTVAAAAGVGVGLTDHQSRGLDLDLMSTEGRDLVLVMSRAQLRHVVALDRSTWPRAFTLKELVRRASQVLPAGPAEGFDSWLHRVAEGRRAADLMNPSPVDDISDPYGRPRREHVAMVAELSSEIDMLVRLGPWRISAV